MNKLRAFTLAEIMITMCLLGSLAVLTLRNVGSNVQRQSRLAEFKTGYSKFDIAVKTVIAEKGTSVTCYACPSENDKKKYGLYLDGTCEAKTSCESLETDIMKELGIATRCKNSEDSSCIPPRYPKGTGCFTDYSKGNTYILQNGMIVVTDGDKSLTQFLLDVNGKRGPNKWGEDMFTFAITAADSQISADKMFVSSLAVLPPSNCLLGGGTGRTKSSAQMLEEMSNKK